MPRRAWHSLGAVVVPIVLAACSESAPLSPRAQLEPTATASMATAGGPSRDVPVTSTIIDDQSFQIRSDGFGSYPNSKTVNSVIQNTSGDWAFDTNVSGSTRTVYLDFSRGIPGSGPNGGDPVPLASGYYQVHIISKCHLYNLSYLTIAPQQTVTCPLRVGQIFIGTQEYAVHMNPVPNGTDGTWPETNPANVTCNSTSGACASWTVTPSGTGPDGSPANVGALLAYYTSTTKGKTTTTIVKQGDYYLSFHFDLTKQ
jgi:hypothetical protein